MCKERFITEWCPNCCDEVKLDNEFRVQICPTCGKWILPCSMCDMDKVDCSKCKLCEEVNQLEEDSKEVFNDIQRELTPLVRDTYDKNSIAESLLAEVYTDITETADEDYTNADVRISIVRVLKKRLNIEE
jgi:hypothetical protein